MATGAAAGPFPKSETCLGVPLRPFSGGEELQEGDRRGHLEWRRYLTEKGSDWQVTAGPFARVFHPRVPRKRTGCKRRRKVGLQAGVRHECRRSRNGRLPSCRASRRTAPWRHQELPRGGQRRRERTNARGSRGTFRGAIRWGGRDDARRCRKDDQAAASTQANPGTSRDRTFYLPACDGRGAGTVAESELKPCVASVSNNGRQ